MKGRRRRDDDGRLERLLAGVATRLPAPPDDELRALAKAAAATPRSGAPRGRLRPLHLRWAVGLAVATVLVGGFGFGLGSWSTASGTAGTSFVGVGFLPAKGWTVVQSGTFSQAGAPRAIAANVPLHPDDGLADAPVATLEALPPAGVLISATFGVRGDLGLDAMFPVRSLPLGIDAAEAVPRSLEPLPLRRPLAQYRLRAGIGRYNVDARIYFGSASPSPAQLAVAQAQLSRLVVASERVTIFARPTVHERGQLVTLLGSAEGAGVNDIVGIEAKECGQTAFSEAFEVHPHEGGGWTLQISPTITTTYRAVWKGTRSATITVQDRAWVQLNRRPRTAKGFGFAVAVRSKLQFWKRHVVVQRLDRRLGRWLDMKQVVLTETGAAPGSTFVWSSAEFSTAVPRGTVVRAVFPLSQARPCHLAGYSNQLTTYHTVNRLGPHGKEVVMDAREPTDASVFAQSAAEPQAFTIIFERHYRSVHAYLTRRVGRTLADDLAAETFTRAFERRSAYDTTAERALPWLFGIAINLLAHHRRSEIRQLRALAASGEPEQLERIDEAAARRTDARRERHALVHALEQLDDYDREALLLFAWGELSYQEVAGALGIPVGTVRSRLNRARRKLRQALAQQPDDNVVQLMRTEVGHV